MPKLNIQKEVESKDVGWKAPPIKYTDYELSEFDKIAQPYFDRTVMLFGKEEKVFNWKKFYFDQGATTKDGAVIINNLTYRPKILKDGTQEWHPYSCDTPQEELENKLEQWKFWLEKDKWIEKKKIEELQKMSEQVVDTFEF